MGHQEGCVTLLKSPRYRLRAFVSTILKRLNKPPFLPQFCSTRANLYVIHTMAPRPTVIGTQGYRRGLASLSVVKERVLPSPSECPGRLSYGRPFELDRLAVTPNQLARDLSGGTYAIALRDLAFQLCFPSLRWDFASCLSCLAACFGNPLRNFFSPATRH
jgi:hypothetical protein